MTKTSQEVYDYITRFREEVREITYVAPNTVVCYMLIVDCEALKNELVNHGENIANTLTAHLRSMLDAESMRIDDTYSQIHDRLLQQPESPEDMMQLRSYDTPFVASMPHIASLCQPIVS
jgi:hypothetical protein